MEINKELPKAPLAGGAFIMLTFGGKIWIKSVMEETWHKKNLKAKSHKYAVQESVLIKEYIKKYP